MEPTPINRPLIPPELERVKRRYAQAAADQDRLDRERATEARRQSWAALRRAVEAACEEPALLAFAADLGPMPPEDLPTPPWGRDEDDWPRWRVTFAVPGHALVGMFVRALGTPAGWVAEPNCWTVLAPDGTPVDWYASLGAVLCAAEAEWRRRNEPQAAPEIPF